MLWSQEYTLARHQTAWRETILMQLLIFLKFILFYLVYSVLLCMRQPIQNRDSISKVKKHIYTHTHLSCSYIIWPQEGSVVHRRTVQLVCFLDSSRHNSYCVHVSKASVEHLKEFRVILPVSVVVVCSCCLAPTQHVQSCNSQTLGSSAIYITKTGFSVRVEQQTWRQTPGHNIQVHYVIMLKFFSLQQLQVCWHHPNYYKLC